MCTSGERSGPAERRLADGSTALLRLVPFEDPVAQALVARVQQEYVVRYGGPDGAAVDPEEFRPPAGAFMIAEVDGRPAGCGAWRVHAVRTVEVKRMYVEPAFRRRGLARVLLAELERSAAAAGHRSVVLNTGLRQPEALALYEAVGYRPVPGYGLYADSPTAVFLGRDLPTGGEERTWAS